MRPTNTNRVGITVPDRSGQAMSPTAPAVEQASLMEPVDDAVDHIRGSVGGPVLVEYGDYECPYARAAYRNIKKVERRLGGRLRLAFRHFPLTTTHPHAHAAAAAAEAAALQNEFWNMHEVLLHGQAELEDDDLCRYADELALDVARFDDDRRSAGVFARVQRDVESGIASGEVFGSPTVFIDGVLHRGPHDVPSLLRALAGLGVS
jgi:protein-disulfide isomerase